MTTGDGDGRRIARRRALLCAEAAMVARSLEVLLRRAEVDSSSCGDLIKLLGGHEQSLLQKAYGRVNPRKRYKGSVSHPLLDGRTPNLLFIDESGKSGPEPTQQPPFFTLGGVSMEEGEVTSVLSRGLDQVRLASTRPGQPSCHVVVGRVVAGFLDLLPEPM